MISLRGGKVYIFPHRFRCFSPWSPWPIDFGTKNKMYIMAESEKTLISCNQGEKRNRRTGLPKYTPSDLPFPSGPLHHLHNFPVAPTVGNQVFDTRLRNILNLNPSRVALSNSCLITGHLLISHLSVWHGPFAPLSLGLGSPAGLLSPQCSGWSSNVTFWYWSHRKHC